MSLSSAPERNETNTFVRPCTPPLESSASPPPVANWLQRLCRTMVENHLRHLKHGCLTLCEGERVSTFGEPEHSLQARVVVRHPRFYESLAFSGGLGAAESLIQNEWSSEEVVNVVRLFSRNMQIANGLEQGLAAIRHLGARIGHWLRRNNTANSRRNIHEHYDLGNDFFQTFLDPTMCYSSGVFPAQTATMEEASIGKLERVCRKLELTPEDHLLEIGTGWGALAIHAAKHFGCRVTTTTISEEQYLLARERIAAAGLSDRIVVLKEDYRNLTGSFDKLVSIEMIEAVGHQYFDTYFAACSRLLRPQGRLLLQAITIKEQGFHDYIRSVDFIRRYIFPGGCLPSVHEMLASTMRATDLRPTHLEDITEHYVVTLQRWRLQFWANIDRIRAQGFDERFIRMWDYYFAYCEAAFREHQVGCVQLVLSKPSDLCVPTGWQLPQSAILQHLE